MNKVISFSSGKGGVGKTSLVANLGVLWAKAGRRVLLIDGDWSLGKLGVMMNVRPTWTLEKVLSQEISLVDAIHNVSPGLDLLASPSGLIGFEELAESSRHQLFFEFESLLDKYDLLLIDHSSGIHWNVLQFAAASHQHVVVTTCEPTSYTDAYAIIKILLKRFQIREFQIIATMSHHVPETERILERFQEVVWNQLGIQVQVLGILPWDLRLPESIRKQKAFVDLYPHVDFTSRLMRMGQRIESTQLSPSGGLKFFLNQGEMR